MFEVGDQVRIGQAGVSRFPIIAIEDEHAIIEQVATTPGGYPFPTRLVDLVAADTDGYLR